jgi:hypothetical protein
MIYDKDFLNQSQDLFSKIKRNRPVQECLNANAQCTITTEHLWFIFYAFFAIHNPKMEDYMQKKTEKQHIPDILKNMLKRRNHTSTIVFQLYTHAYTNQGNVSVIYPKYKNDITKQLIKSHQTNNLKTTAVLLRKTSATSANPALREFIDYLITTQPISRKITTSAHILDKINNDIHYQCKDIIILALACYMKIDEEDINTKNIFIAVTPEESAATATTATATAANEPEIPSISKYDEKYKYLYT